MSLDRGTDAIIADSPVKDAATLNAERAAATEAADERATRIVIRVGIGLLIMLAIWIPIVLWAFLD